MKFYILNLQSSKRRDRYAWWGVDGGDVENIDEAKVYTKEEIESNLQYFCNDSAFPVPVKTVEKMTTYRVLPTLSRNWDVLGINLNELLNK